jgi:hypothetical protein
MPWWVWILGINLLFILFTDVFPYIENSYLKWNIVNHFNLAGEMNLAAWWSGSLLLLCGILAYQNSTSMFDLKNEWLLLAIAFSLLSFDEIGSLHERISNISVGLYILLIAGLIGGGAYGYVCWMLWKRGQNKKGVLFLIVGAALFASAAPNEYLEHHVDWPYYLEGARVAFEEGLEITGMLVCLIGIAGFQKFQNGKASDTHFLLNSEQSKRLQSVLTIAFFLHIGISWIVSHNMTIEFRGNPAVWYFMAVFFLLAVTYGWKMLFDRQDYNYSHIFLVGYFLVLSAGSLYFIFPRFNSKLHELWFLADANVFLGCQLILLFFIYILFFKQITRKSIFFFFALAFTLVGSYYLNELFVMYVVSGLFALVNAYMFLPKSSLPPIKVVLPI